MTKNNFKIQGKVFKFLDNVDTDQIIPARYLDTTVISELAKHSMEGIDENFASNVEQGDIIIAGKNFGCGSSREHAPLSIKGAGIGAVVAQSFARIFFRNAINIGLPVIECEDFVAKTGDEVSIDLKKGKIINHTTSAVGTFAEFGDFLSEIISSGGLMEKIRKDVINE